MSKYQIPLSYNAIDHDGFYRVLEKYKGQNHQLIIRDFEDKIKSMSGAQHAVALHSGTAALHLALKVLGVGKGDKVLVSTFTYVASVSPILYCGASPVFIDSELETWNMDPELLEEALTDLDNKGEKAKAIIVVHAYGMPAQLEKILPIAKKWKVPVIEDAAEAFGATINGKWAGTLAEMGIFSFNNNKSVTTFGGGVLVTGNEDWATHARKLSTHAREDKPYYVHQELGFNYSMSPLNAAYGLLACNEAPDLIKNRRVRFEQYRVALKGEVTFQEELPGVISSRWLTTVRFRTAKVQIVRQLTDNQHFEIRKVWNPMHLQPLFKEEKAYLSGHSEALFQSAVCLPSGPVDAKMFDQMIAWLQSVH